MRNTIDPPSKVLGNDFVKKMENDFSTTSLIMLFRCLKVELQYLNTLFLCLCFFF